MPTMPLKYRDICLLRPLKRHNIALMPATAN
nr:MAG TPA: hypothetical protein [Caudoviricetes sp.]